MAQLWGGRFTKETDQLVYNFNASLGFDQKLYKQDITGSMAHASMLAKQGILTEEEKEEILDGLKGILEDIQNGKLEFSPEYEDIHSFVEANLIDRKGGCGQEASYRKKPERPGGFGYEDVCPGRDRRDRSPFERAAGISS